MALQQLRTSVITMKDIVDKDHDGQSAPSNMALDPCGRDTWQTDSKHDERAVEDAIQDTSEANASSHNTSSHPSATMHQPDERAGVDGPSMGQSGTDDHTEDSSDDGPDKVGIIHGLKNVPWKMLLDLLYVHQYTLVDWPVGVPAVGADFNVKRLNADELQSLTSPFLKEQMGDDYLSEVPRDDEDVDDDHLVPVPGSSFYLQDWSTGSLIFVSP
ncbi:hypothetical protein PISMIDRAFT_10947 [Pisolithus microcarpus 441]|uniref:Uncharacterized protein n=1 Tax=Pisolithus microcarpus 441 TaxID=765257 RepID=A0A0C9ZBH6_9AGAM|nr:hypothetical protein PISMIDRAFT_10947 [Pisolithus microcarpus 441]